MSDLEKTIHYTTKAELICSNLIKYIPDTEILIEPFVGAGDLLYLFPNAKWEKYDIEDKGNNIVQDTLKQPPDYKNKWVITNPPYLAKNKAKEKDIFNLYNTDDLYKASILSMLEAEGGILIIPTNFFTDEMSASVRKQFLDCFKIEEINIFTEPVFETTTYSVCSFAFKRKNKGEEYQTIPVNIQPANKKISINLDPKTFYRIAGSFYKEIESIKPIFGRLIGSTSSDYITNIKLYAIDTRSQKIRLEYDTTPFEGKISDRTYATFTCKYKLTEEEEKEIIEEFNKKLNAFREEYADICLTNYRDYNRKRIGFDFAYKLASKVYRLR